MKKKLAIFSYWIIGLMLVIIQCLFDPMALKSVADILQSGNVAFRMICGYLVLLLISTSASPLLKIISNIIREKLIAQKVMGITSKIMARLLRSDGVYLKRHGGDALVVQLSADRERYSSIHWTLILDLPIACVALLIMATMMFMGSYGWLEKIGFLHLDGNWILALVVIGMSPLHMAFLLLSKKVMAIEQKRTEAVCNENQNLMEFLRGVDDIWACNAFIYTNKHIESNSKTFAKARIRLFTLSTAIELSGAIAWGVTQVVLLTVCAYLICKPGIKFSYADYVGFSVLSGMFNTYITRISQIALEWQNSRQAVKRMSEFEAIQIEQGAAKHPSIKDQSVQLDDVSFKYNEGSLVLNDVHLLVRSGEHIAIVGPSGSGKSTLLKILSRMEKASSGAVTIGGVSIDKFGSPDYAKFVGYVPQKPFLFSGTIRDNILLGRSASDDRVIEVLEDVGLIDDLWKRGSDLQHAFSEEIGQSSNMLSGGQMVKLSLARALLLNPSILLLDEVTSPLDELSLWHILETLKDKYSDKTIIMVTHRLEPTKFADKIVVVDEGRIVQTGTFNELRQQEGLFKKLLNNGLVV